MALVRLAVDGTCSFYLDPDLRRDGLGEKEEGLTLPEIKKDVNSSLRVGIFASALQGCQVYLFPRLE